MKTFQNYHRHTSYSNIFTPDSPSSIEDYAKRAKELGHKILSSAEHGWQGHYYKVYEMAKKYDLKFIFGTEAYWVKDRLESDRTNCHIIILAKNEEGRKEINDVLSEASITGYHYKPRVDLELLLSLNPKNIMITTACVGFWQYEDIEDILIQLHNHFNKNLYLEVQYHNTDKQKALNKRIVDLSYKYDIKMIMGCDSHYIYESDNQERYNLLEAKGLVYPEEEGWFLDYPDYDMAYNRFIEQDILSPKEITEAMDNTNLILDFEDITFSKDIKLPSLYPDKTQEWKDKKLRHLINEVWRIEYLPYLSKEKKQVYLEGIRNELQTIVETKMTDYFLLDYEIVKEGKRRGGIISKTARGSGGSFFINTLLGFSNLNRFESPVKLYPERFMSKTRIIETKSLPDLDLNLGTVDIFAQVQKELLGENHAYPMIAFGQLKTSSAFKLYCKSQGVDYGLANEISKQIKKYEKVLKNADSEEEKELIYLYDYVDEEYKTYIDESKKYQGIIDNKSVHPCGYLVYQGDIRREIGLIKCKSESTKKEYITTVIDGYVAEEYKFVKNDLLKVDVANTVKNIYDNIGIEQHSIQELTKIIENDNKTWEIYANGYTLGINQMESSFGIQCCKQYKPRNVAEITALVSALRPGFKSMLQIFLARKPYSTGVKVLDDLLEDSFHFIMYQENIMTYLGWLGIEQTETYAVIKKISKKKFKKTELDELKGRLSMAWKNNTGNYDGFEESFKVVEDFSLYAFNASHAYAYAYDSLYGAYLKANFPYHFYSVMLQTYTDKGKKDKVTAYKKEMKEAFDIDEGSYKFRLDNRSFSIDEENQRILPSLASIKNMGKNAPQELYDMRTNEYSNFIDMLDELKSTSLNKTMIDILIKLDYFSEFGTPTYLLKIVEIYEQWNGRVQIKKEQIIEWKYDVEDFKPFGKETEKQLNKIDNKSIMNMLINRIEDKTSILERLIYQHKTCGYCFNLYPKFSNKALVLDVDLTYAPKITLYKIDTGEEIIYKAYKKSYNVNIIKQYDMVQIGKTDERPKQKKVGDEYIPIDGFDNWLMGWKKLN